MASKNNVENESSKEIDINLSSKATESLYLNSKLADVHFTFKSSDERIPAHRSILAVSSPVFEAEFFGPMAEKDEVKIEDAHAEAFKEFLQIFYLKKAKLSMEHIRSVMYLGKKYQVDECLNVCLTFLNNNLTIGEMCWGYQLAMYYEQNELKEFCKDHITAHTEDVLKSEEFLNCDWNVLMEIVKFDEINCRETVLLEACIDWAQNACKRNKLNVDDKENIRKQLKDVIYEIRFDQFTFPELVKFMNKPLDPYNHDELKEIIRIIGKDNITSTKFNCSARLMASETTDSRSISWDDSKKLECVRVLRHVNRYFVPKLVSTIFSSNKPLIFRDFRTYIGNAENVRVSISLERMDTGRKIIEDISKMIYIEYDVRLSKPIIIESNVKYKITLDFSSNYNLISTMKMQKEVKLNNGTMITFHHDDDASSNFDIVFKGAIYHLTFNEYDI